MNCRLYCSAATHFDEVALFWTLLFHSERTKVQCFYSMTAILTIALNFDLLKD